MKFRAKALENGTATVYERGSMMAYIASLAGKEIVFDIALVKIKKTVRQNNGIYLLIDHFKDYLNQNTGNDLSVEDVKKMIKTEKGMIECVYDKHTGEYITDRFKSFADLSLQEASELIEWLYAWSATEWNITLPELKMIE